MLTPAALRSADDTENGTPGNSSSSGVTPGGPASANASNGSGTGDPTTSSAEAYGGTGADNGSGQDGVNAVGEIATDGGAANAQATTTTGTSATGQNSVFASASATAIGGSGGSYGGIKAGLGRAPDQGNTNGADGATGTSDASGSASGNRVILNVYSTATGGNGGSTATTEGGTGGRAASAAATAEGVVSAPGGVNSSSLNVNATASGGNGGSVGTNLLVSYGSGSDGATASATATGMAVGNMFDYGAHSYGMDYVTATATGGSGGSGASGGSSGNGASATAAASGTSSGTANFTVSATAIGGNGGSGYLSSYLDGFSEQHAAGASSNGGDGGSIDLENAVSGSTQGTLILKQKAVGGNAGSTDGLFGANAGNAGTATSVLDIDQPGGKGSLSISSEADGGNGGSIYGANMGDPNNPYYVAGSTPTSNASNGGSADSSASGSTGDNNVSISVSSTALGGAGGFVFQGNGQNGVEGDATSSSTANATGDFVTMTVNSNATGGLNASSTAIGTLHTGSANISSSATAANPNARAQGTSDAGASLTVSGYEYATGNLSDSNLVSGSTSGNLVLQQTVIAYGNAAATLNEANGGGGSLTLSSTATSSGTGTAINEVQAESGSANILLKAIGLAQSASSSAQSETTATATGTNTSITVSDFAQGHTTASSDAEGETINGAGSISASAMGASPTASAYGISSDGGKLNVSATENDIVGSVSFSNGATGSTSGTLSLVLKAVAGVTNPTTSDGGNAISGLEQTNPGGGSISVSSSALGGSGVNGGSAQNTSEAGSSDDHVAVVVQGAATGGNTYNDMHGVGGGATSVSTGTATGTNTSVTVTDMATGGAGLDGGAAYSTASGSSIAGAVTVSASAIGGASFNTGASAVATASGMSSNGGAVSVSASETGGSGASDNGHDGGVGADIQMSNSVSGNTSGTLALSQTAIGGSGGASYVDGYSAGSAGSAQQNLVIDTEANHTGGGDLILNGSAMGGTGGSQDFSTFDYAQGTDGGAATNNVQATSALDNRTITVNGNAQGGNGGAGFEGTSGGQGGDGGDATSTSSANVTGNHENVVVSDTATGGTAGGTTGVVEVGGNLYLEDDGIGYGGQGGNASSTATGSTTNGNATITATAYGGGGGSGSGYGFFGQDGGSATATASGTSTDGGNLTITANAYGGAGGEGDINSGFYGPGQGSANAGNGASVDLENAVIGSTTGKLVLSQNAWGGYGGDAGLDSYGYAGAAGDAKSVLTINNTTASQLSVSTSATGGDAGNDSYSSGYAGFADSESTATGQNTVYASATAWGGFGNSMGGGYARASATVVNVGGTAQAVANSFGNNWGRSDAIAEAQNGTGVVQTVTSESYTYSSNNSFTPAIGVAQAGIGTASFGQAMPSGTIQAVSYGTGAPLASEVNNVLSHNTVIANSFASNPTMQTSGLGFLGVSQIPGNYGEVSATVTFTLNNSTPIEDIQLGLLDPTITGTNYDYYYLYAWKEDGAYISWSGDPSALLNDTVFDIGALDPESSEDLKIGLVMMSSTPGETLATNFILGTSTTPSTNGISITDGTYMDVSDVSQIGSSPITISGGEISIDVSSNETLSQNITFTGTGGFINNGGSGVLTLSGTIDKDHSVLILSGGKFIVSGQITGGNSSSYDSDFEVNNNGYATITGTNNNYSGPTRINSGGTLVNGVENALPAGTTIIMGRTDDGEAVTNTYDLNGYDQTVAAITSNSNGDQSNINLITNNGASGVNTLTLTGTGSDGSQQNSNFIGTIGDGLAAQIALSITGGTHTLGGANTYSGGTSIASGGSLIMANGTNGSATGTGPLTVASGGTIGGAGTSRSTSFSINGNVMVGNGTDTTSQTTLVASSASTFTNAKLTFNLGQGTLNGQSNTLNLEDTSVTFNGTQLVLNLFGSGSIADGTQYTLFTTSDPDLVDDAALYGLVLSNGNVIASGLSISPDGNFSSEDVNGYVMSGQFAGSYLYVSGSNIMVNVEVQAVPEPGTWALMLAGLAGLALWQKRRKSP